MEKEERLLQKTFYEEAFLGNSQEEPVQLLGRMFFQEQQEEMPDLSAIRFAQGEVYFHAQDYEAAIYKWEHVHNELMPWAKKNIADTYMELELWDAAEPVYKSIEADSPTLTAEVALQLFTLYLEQGRMDEADSLIKNTVAMYPDYPNVTKLARAFFEERQDWESAIQLASDESIRTKRVYWFDVLEFYAEQGKTNIFAPDFFMPVLKVWAEMDRSQFEKKAAALWLAYGNGREELDWLGAFNRLIEEEDGMAEHRWPLLSSLYRQAFGRLVCGLYPIEETKEHMPPLLHAWLSIAANEDRFYAAAAALAWNDQFPETIGRGTVPIAERILSDSDPSGDLHVQALALFADVEKWAKDNQLDVDPLQKWAVAKLASAGETVAIAGLPGNGKDKVLDLLLPVSGQPAFEDRSAIMYEDREGTADINGDVVETSSLNSVLSQNGLSVLDVKNLDWLDDGTLPDYLYLPQSLVFVLGSQAPFTNHERSLLMAVREQQPQLPIHFILSVEVAMDEEAIRLLNEETAQRIGVYFPESQLLAVPEGIGRDNQGLIEWVKQTIPGQMVQSLKTGMILIQTRRAISGLLGQQEKVERELAETIEYQGEILSRLQGSVHQLQDMEEEKISSIRTAYRSIMEEIKPAILKKIPSILRGTAELVTDDRDFRNLHLELNSEMNNRITAYLETEILPIYTSSLQDWIEFARAELDVGQAQLFEWQESFNAMLEGEAVRLDCDYQIFTDWKRDADRMMSSVILDQENILLRRTPGQVLLKGAGKLFGALPKNNSMLVNSYKSFVENEPYEDTAESVAKSFFSQFELFEKGIARDISFFFRDPAAELRRAVKEKEAEAEANKAALSKMLANPDAFRSPILLFEMRLRQYEWMNAAEQANLRIGQRMKSR